jgi:uncharacterized membrane protein
MRRRFTPGMIALTALLIALTTILTWVVQIPSPARGYFNLSDVAITFTSLAFGPIIGMITGGVGTAFADILSGFGFFAPLSLIAHGLEGLIIGTIAMRSRSVSRMILAWLAGSLVMIACYLVGEGLFYTGWPAAIAEVPGNLFQAVIGGLVGIPLVIAVRQAYPPIDQMGQPRTWTE